ncbi:hypothetical protein B0H10DRAFT_955578 [Mycena sp. CBHHK59/15]|nr:hypothetical protein B0H10DRAFT_955578 [Mycena sp. CBHHK59/15]
MPPQNLVQGYLVNGSVGQVIGFSTPIDAIKQHTEIATMDADKAVQEPRMRDQLWPLVQFSNGAQRLCVPQEFTINNADGHMEARRDQVWHPPQLGEEFCVMQDLQVPLILAWALSVHKSQGQTLERVKVDLGRTFEKGQGTD